MRYGVATSARGDSEGRGDSKGSIVFSTREMEFSLLYDGSFVVSWDINEKDRYGVDSCGETSGIY